LRKPATSFSGCSYPKGHFASSIPRVVIVGAGFGGLEAAKALAGAPVEVTVVDRRNHHLFQPLLYQVATASLNPSEIAVPIRRVLRDQANATVILGSAERVDTAGRRVILGDGQVPYDYLVLATGAAHSYFGHDDWATHAPGLKSLQDALEMRRKMLIAFEAAERETTERAKREWLTFVIVGGGPTGVELAGALADIARRSLPDDFRHVDPRSARVILVEGLPRILPAMLEKLSQRAKTQLERMGVEVRTSSMVTGITRRGVQLGEEWIESHNVFWAAGVSASPLAKSLGVELDGTGRVPVTPELRAPGHHDVFVIGDLAALNQDGKPVPGVAPAAMQQGRHVAANIRRAVRGEALEPFRYVHKGTLATIGRAAGVADIRGLRLSGLVAWLAWLFVHIWFLIGFRNRVVVMLEWARAYFTSEKQARLITEEVEKVLGPL
jgi:NADH:ubiquinone reductase (H+-translocating)